MNLQTADHIGLGPRGKIWYKLNSVPFGMEKWGEIEGPSQRTPRHLEHSVHIGLEPGQIFGQGVQIEVMDDD